MIWETLVICGSIIILVLAVTPWILIAKGVLITARGDLLAALVATQPDNPDGDVTSIRQVRASGGQFTEANPGAKRIHRKMSARTDAPERIGQPA